MCSSSITTLRAISSFLTFSDSEGLHVYMHGVSDQDRGIGGGGPLLCCTTGFLNAPGFADVSAKLCVVRTNGYQPSK